MGEIRGKRRGSAKWLSVGSTGLLAAVGVMMLLVPVAAGAVAPTVVLKAPYKGTFSIPNQYTSSYGCGGFAKGAAPKWVASSGSLLQSVIGVGKVCKSVGSYGGGGSGYAGDGMTVLLPFKVGANGNHSIASSWTITLASTKVSTYGGCPAKNVNYHPAMYVYSSGSCYDSASINFYAFAYLTDLSNSSWYFYNSSGGSAYNSSYFSNYTSCYNYGTPTCSNSTYGSNYSYSYGYNAPGFSAFTWNGATTFTFWTNGTKMVKADKFAVVFGVSVSATGYAQVYNLLAPWAVTASGSINMATLGNGAKVNSVTIV